MHKVEITDGELELLNDFRAMVRGKKFGEIFIAFNDGMPVNYWCKLNKSPSLFNDVTRLRSQED